MKIVVVGSLNLDRFARVARLPRAGETVLALDTFERFGGKGANQAVAAARLGASVTLIGAVADDAAGVGYRERLATEGVDTTYLFAKHGRVRTGTATIAVDGEGENLIIVDPGANALLTPEDVRRAAPCIAEADVVLMQLEVPLPAVLEAANLAAQAGRPIVFNPSPWQRDFPWTTIQLHTVVVNRGESIAWLGEPRFPAELNVARVVITQGAEGTLALTRHERVSVDPPRVDPVDTVGAGDAFAGAYAVALGEGRSLLEALDFANTAGALATLRAGAQEALPTRHEVEKARVRV